ncbi:MAG: hypothetical protein ISR49_18775 [Alphaproteobacteria bacterium]|nr:hypothetical protein [Alphaproteobacteria bacterium]
MATLDLIGSMQSAQQTPVSDRWTTIRCSWGLAILLVGQSAGWAVRSMLGLREGVIFSVMPALLSMVLLFQPSWFLRARLRVDASHLATPLLLALTPLVVSVLLTDPSNLIVYGSYLIVCCVIGVFIALHHESSFRDLPFAVLVVGLFGSLVPILQIATNGAAHVARIALDKNSNVLGLASSATIAALAALIVGTSVGKTFWLKILASGAFVVNLAVAVLTFTRSVWLSLALCIPIYLLLLRGRMEAPRPGRRGDLLSWIAFWGLPLLAVSSAPVALAAVFGTKVLDFMVQFGSKRIFTAIDFVSAGPLVGDTSTVEHSRLFGYSWDRLGFWGHGIDIQERMAGSGIYPHNSYLQAAYDGGILLGFLFLLISAVIPLSLLVLRFRWGKLTATDAFLVLLFINVQGDQLFHATPYNSSTWTVVLLVYLLIARPAAQAAGTLAAA